MHNSYTSVVVGGSSSLGRKYIEIISPQTGNKVATYFNNRLDHSPSVEWIKCDVTQESDLNSLKNKILAIEFPIRLVWFIGVLSREPDSFPTLEEISYYFKVNVMSALYLVSALTPSLQPGSRVCLCGSVSATNGSYDLAYSSSKSALIGLIKSSKRLCGEDVSVFGVAPNSIEDSAMFEGFSDETKKTHRARSGANMLTRAATSKEILRLMCLPADATCGEIFPIVSEL